jgi:hypothetical protein
MGHKRLRLRRPVWRASQKIQRLRRRETANGAGMTAEITTSGAADELAAGDEGMKTAGVRAGEISRFSDAWGFVLSMLERANIDGGRRY